MLHKVPKDLALFLSIKSSTLREIPFFYKFPKAIALLLSIESRNALALAFSMKLIEA